MYLTNVEGVCRRFCEDKRVRLAWLKLEGRRFKDFWQSLSPELQGKLLMERSEVLLKVSEARPCTHAELFAHCMCLRCKGVVGQQITVWCVCFVPACSTSGMLALKL